ncbi:hypothetical protein QBC33DRAFT_513679 [Phialemonium atrogriseum]|uniref:Uncharacterized protein n=1 Tax=Phialemonium atrogriseum TaxID=1093897 RepID=A0AAJ0FN87_9PEZI|nr:uncharacterized protein QBC33DRAFT_513679 [Phialemonium atrogriseum]KAK1768734.1 hypothetical protein QBC33DRAFT_513679 [Phialemonium atrogriseum]
MDTFRGILIGLVRDVFRDLLRDMSRDVIRDLFRDIFRDVFRDIFRDMFRAISRNEEWDMFPAPRQAHWLRQGKLPETVPGDDQEHKEKQSEINDCEALSMAKQIPRDHLATSKEY